MSQSCESEACDTVAERLHVVNDWYAIGVSEAQRKLGYLLHEFLSPLANRRSDIYAGSLENRMRFPLEVFSAVREVWPEAKPLGMRLSASVCVQRRAASCASAATRG